MMKIPYNRVHAHGDVLLAARGGKIHAFSLLDGKHISTWHHPDVLAKPLGAAEGASSNASVELGETREAAGDEPPAKRQRLENGQPLKASAGEVNAPVVEAPAAQGEDGARGHGQGEDKGKAKANKKSKNTRPENQVARAPERPLITQLMTTADGRHVLAVSGHDKVIWVFQYDGQGGLTQISQRY